MKNSIIWFFLVFLQFGTAVAVEQAEEELSLGAKIEQFLAKPADEALEKDPLLIADLISVFEECGYYNDSFLQADSSRSTKYLADQMLEDFSHHLLAGRTRSYLIFVDHFYPIERLSLEQMELLESEGVAKLLRPYLINRLHFPGFVWGKILSPTLSESKQIKMYQRIKSFGVTVEDLENLQAYPLHIALMQKHRNFVKVLVADGARPGLEDKRRCTPELIARAKRLSFDE